MLYYYVHSKLIKLLVLHYHELMGKIKEHEWKNFEKYRDGQLLMTVIKFGDKLYPQLCLEEALYDKESG